MYSLWAGRALRQRRRILIAAAAISLLLIALSLRLFDLDAYLNIDAGHGWMSRTRRFWHAIDTGQWAKTFQKTHPGVTLMWMAGPFIEHGPGWSSLPGPAHVAAGAMPVALVGGLLAPATYWLWLKVAGPRHQGPAFLAGLLIATEPFLVAHSRTMHLDQLLTAFAWVGLLCTALMLRRGRWRWAVLAGLCFGLSVLTKISAGGLALGAGVWCLLAWATSPKPILCRARLVILPQLALMTLVAITVVWAAWPALWEKPEAVLERLLREGRSLVEGGHKTFFLGEVSGKDPGPLFYPVLALYRTAPETLLAMAVGAWWLLRRRRVVGVLTEHVRRSPVRPFVVGLLIAHLPLLMLITLGAKKMDRYVLPFQPLVCLLAAYGLWWVALRVHRWSRGRLQGWRLALVWALVCAPLVARAARLVSVHPYAIAWAAEYLPWPAEEAIQMGWGEGLREAGEWIAHDAGPGAQPVIWSGMHQNLRPYVPNMRRGKLHEAQYLVRYISIRQRKWWSGHFKRYGKRLLHEVVLEGRVYVEIWAGVGYPRRE